MSFSLTQKFLIDPVLRLEAPLPPLQPGEVRGRFADYQIPSKIAARVLGIFISVLAASDCLLHLTTGVYQGSKLLAGRVLPLSLRVSSENVKAHFLETVKFAKLTVVGSLIGLVAPQLLKGYRYCPSFYTGIDAPQYLLDSVNNPYNVPIAEKIMEKWDSFSLEEKASLVRELESSGLIVSDEQNLPALTQTVYQPISRNAKNCNWTKLQVWPNPENHRETFMQDAFYFHATSEKGLISILKSKKIEVRHEKAFKGAFVSTKPDHVFGKCILVLSKNIERLSPLEHGFRNGHDTYWAGFSHDIPVTKDSLAWVFFDGSQEDCEQLKKQCRTLTGRSISVIPFFENHPNVQAVQNLNLGIPKEWPSEDGATANMILDTLQARAQSEAVFQPRQQLAAMA